MTLVRRSWAKRTQELHGELSAIAKTDLAWWLLAGGAAAAEPWGAAGEYVISDATPTGDTFLGTHEPTPRDPVADAIVRARAAAAALRELDGELPAQPLAVTIQTQPDGGRATLVPSTLDVAAFAVGARCVIGRLDDPTLPAQVAAAATGSAPLPWHGPTPFVCVSLGDDPPEVARHAHRRAWRHGAGPWLGLGRSGELATVSTCHLVVDGYGHARIAALLRTRPSTTTVVGRAYGAIDQLPALRPVDGAIALGVAWRALPHPSPRALPLAYALGRLLHRTGRRDAPFSPTFQIPIAPGDRDDPQRLRRRVVPGIVSVRFDDGEPEPYASFEQRARDILAREAAGHGLCTRLLAAARAAPAPLAWKRKSIGATRARWLERFAEVIGGRACLSKIRVDAALPPTCAVSSPARLATPTDPLGGCVITVLDDGEHASITACGSGLAGSTAAANELLDELIELL
ncbi:MAG TPA: hypothetical protein VFQ53_30435 [Kofleriaceae bacterium]|nr:hypothetical protein [Kofleriaceae bacterium]